MHVQQRSAACNAVQQYVKIVVGQRICVENVIYMVVMMKDCCGATDLCRECNIYGSDDEDIY